MLLLATAADVRLDAPTTWATRVNRPRLARLGADRDHVRGPRHGELLALMVSALMVVSPALHLSPGAANNGDRVSAASAAGSDLAIEGADPAAATSSALASPVGLHTVRTRWASSAGALGAASAVSAQAGAASGSDIAIAVPGCTASAPAISTGDQPSTDPAPAGAAGAGTQPGTTPVATPVATSPWAVAPSMGSSQAPAQWVQKIAATGVTTVRGLATSAAGVKLETDAGLDVTGILQWWPTGQSESFPVDDLDGWRAYVRQMVTTYPQVDHWEVWNEPPNFTADSDPVHYAQIVVAAYDTAKSVNSSVKIGLDAKATHIRWLAEAIQGGAAGHFDYVTLHPYERAGLLPTGNEEDFMAIVPQVRAMLKAVDPAQSQAPVRFTEVGEPVDTASSGKTYPTGTVSAATQADTLVKVYTMGIAQGAESIAWYDPWDGDYWDAWGVPPYGLIAKDGTPRPSYTALKTLISSLGTRPTYLGWTALGTTGYAFAFADGADVDLVAWASGGDQTLTFPAGATVMTPATGAAVGATAVTVGASPKIIRTTGADALGWTSKAAAGLTQSFGTADASATSVSLSAADGKHGLAMVNAPAVTTVDGRPAYDVSSTATVAFVVDPAFSAWSSTKLTVTAVVHAVRGTPGLNLEYDALRPIASLNTSGQILAEGWHGVAATGWTTLTWSVPDASFVGMYGSNFTFDSDSTTYSGYAIASVTVTRG